MTEKTIAISDIDASDRLRPVDRAHAELIAASIEERLKEDKPGLIQPIVVRLSPDGNAFVLTAGAHRLEAMSMLGWTELTVGEHVIVRDTDEISARIDEIDENIARNDLNILDRALFIAERKRLYDEKRAETRGRKRKDVDFKDKEKMAKLAIISSERFSLDAMKRTGLSESVIKRACQLIERLSPEVIAAIRGTMLEDNQNELFQLAELDADRQIAAASAIARGEAKNVAGARVAIGLDKPKIDDPQGRIFAQLVDLWGKATGKTQLQFMETMGLQMRKTDAA